MWLLLLLRTGLFVVAAVVADVVVVVIVVGEARVLLPGVSVLEVGWLRFVAVAWSLGEEVQGEVVLMARTLR